ncbi:sigma-54-dependent Fis family transcriptional regulator [Desulfovibrio sulfodismutans]|uniref:Sigma-54-dependent Fis family transcriptional regulator n=1 Tax=Desulfolutivibrio sulfodismutans TaxID=63561 RepID=A0A7K3NP06_9BACT|nr:sigma-54 dependent transcriptional regulator [Desulfolutivibrio sulfodismutans]NDY57924.1 sigma-54-dependent Fis family transcriptional regulator [Desulfolutivibrio sulfodismutans]QLA14027.1 AAA domain-containing protein [Desulfolutivibrio sulfodismutans DSM 3696]
MPEKTILFVAQAQTVTALFQSLKEAGVTGAIADSLPGALAFLKKSKPILIFTQAKIGIYSAESLLAKGREAGDFPPTVVFTDRGSAAEAQRYLELGAKDYWLEPLSWEKIQAVMPRDGEPGAGLRTGEPGSRAAAAPADRQAHAGVTGHSDAPCGRFAIIGDHPAIRRVLSLARQVAKSRATVLISGESGTGKEMFARFLHAHSDRAQGPFVAINCAALPEHLLESELFGHEKGAFTGAIARKMGKFELAQGGTILLDEISEMDLGLQAKLLRVLQEGEFDRVGGTETVRADVRVLATTNRRLEEYVEEAKFRQDLYYRLNVIPLKLPPLRERGQDIPGLAAYFAEKYCRAYGLDKIRFTAEAMDWLTAYDWPGNVRELQNLMERAVLLAGGGAIKKAHFLLDADNWPDLESDGGDAEETLAPETPIPTDAATAPAPAIPAGDAPDAEGGLVPPGGFSALAGAPTGDIETLDVMERRMIMKSLDKTEGNRTQAAQLLGISVRTLRNKLNEYRKLGMDIP